MIKELNQPTSQTGNPFERTMLMLEIDKRDVEIVQMREQLDLYANSLKTMAEALQLSSQNLFKLMKYEESDWTEFKFILDKYGVEYTESSLSQFALVVPEFIRWKLGRAIGQLPASEEAGL